MKLDRIIIKLRDRSPWEAVDLGNRLVINLFGHIFIPWISIITLFLMLALYIQISGYPLLGLFIFWLFKPLYDSLLLYILSKELFAEKSDIEDISRNIFLWFIPGLKHSIYWWRLSPMRSFVMAIHNLEGLSGNIRKKRIAILQKESSSYAVGLTVMAINYEIIINISLYMAIAFIVPDELYTSIWSGFDGSEQNDSGLIMNTVIYAVAVFLIEPLYLGAGFLLYLNRRIKLEAWDIELVFKQINSRLEKKFSNATN